MAEVLVDILRLGRRGEGIAEVEGHRIFVPLALPGERIAAAMDGEAARLLRLETSSPDRIEPFCPHFGRCGGCQVQHVAENAYRAWKRDLVKAAFGRRGITCQVGQLIDAHGCGRRRVSLHVRPGKRSTSAGFMAMRSHDLVDLDRCPILVSSLAHATAIARELGGGLGICDVALTATDGGIDAALKAGRKEVGLKAARLATLCKDLDLARLSVNGEVIAFRRTPSVSMGRAIVVLPTQSFLQATTAGENELAQLVALALGKTKSVADLFCGVGPFALRMAEKTKIMAIDNDREAIETLSLAAKTTSGLKPVTAKCRDLFRAPLVPGELKEFDSVVFDPPRAGAEAQARQLARSTVQKVVAVSCDPATLARDAEILLGGGYRLLTVTPVDQFKWSFHVETVAVFEKD
jgi:23S rRNA (uracil1939-C5)-methyltransferase